MPQRKSTSKDSSPNCSTACLLPSAFIFLPFPLIPLRLHVAERRGDEDADGFLGGGHEQIAATLCRPRTPEEHLLRSCLHLGPCYQGRNAKKCLLQEPASCPTRPNGAAQEQTR